MPGVLAWAISCFWGVYFSIVLFAALIVTSVQNLVFYVLSFLCCCCPRKDYTLPTDQSQVTETVAV